jgi:cytochrome c biogenesis protein CcdA
VLVWALLLALAGLAFLDSLNVLNVGVVSAVIYDSRLSRRSPFPGALSFIAGVFTVTTIFGLCTVLGLGFLTDLVDIRITPAIRFRGELLVGVTLIGLAYFALTAQSSAPRWAMASTRERPWVLGLLGLAVGVAQAPTAVPYLTGLAMLSLLDPRPPIWPVIIIVYCAIKLSPLLLILALSTRLTARAMRLQRWLVRVLTRYGPKIVRSLLVVVGVGLVTDAVIHHSALW